MGEAEGTAKGSNMRAGTPAFAGGVAGCAGGFGCTGTVANAVFHAELKVTGIVAGVTWETFPWTLLDED